MMSTKGFFGGDTRVILAVLLIVVAGGIVLFGGGLPTGLQAQGGGKLDLKVSHSPTNPGTGDTITITAEIKKGNANWVEIFVDSASVKKCSNAPISPCKYQTSYSVPGKHSYYVQALQTNGQIVKEPNSNPKTFDVKDKKPPTVSVSSDKVVYGKGDKVTITATASDTGGSGLNQLKINVDDVIVKSCSSAPISPCTYAASYNSLGRHTYKATVYDGAGNVGRDPNTGTKYFNITGILVTVLAIKYDRGPVSPYSASFNATAKSSGFDLSSITVYFRNQSDGKLYTKNCDLLNKHLTDARCDLDLFGATPDKNTNNDYWAEAVGAQGSQARDPAAGAYKLIWP